ncbi:MAG: EF-hand domain-containing protein [Asticcacaulis sp.]
MKIKSILKTAALSGLCLSMATGVMAQQLSNSLAKLDKDKDGRVSLSEWTADRPNSFKRMDSNKDGFVTAEEATKHYHKATSASDAKNPGRIQAVLNADTDADGRVSLQEYITRAEWGFRQRDKNGDGYIVPGEG